MSRWLRLAFFPLWLLGAAPALAAPWPAVESDLPPDPALRQGTLPNGLRYAILPNAEPKNRISLRLLVAVGSLHERDDELGLAHFVEHMAFRSTRSHPAGSMVATLQRLGVGLGPDNTAFTFPDHTIYQLELPDTTEATLRDGLGVFREYAEEVTFDAPLIEKERGVILSENATRDTPTARSGLANLAMLWPDSRQVRRPVGGVSETVRSFTREQFVAFYDAWYRPERMSVIAVGDLAPEQAQALIEAEFGNLHPRGAARAEPADIVTAEARLPDVGIFSDAGLLGVQISLEHPRSHPRTEDTHARRTQLLHEALAVGLLQARLQKIAHEAEATFVTPTAQLLSPMAEWQLASISAAGKIDDWTKVAAELEREHRRTFQFGFTVRELAEAKAGLATLYDEATRTAATRRSEMLAGQLADCLIAGAPFVHPTEMQRDMAPVLATTTLADCLHEFRATWSTHSPHVFIAANPSFQITRNEIAKVLNASRATAVSPREEAAPAVFAYDNFGPPGQLVRDEHLTDLDVRLATFANGVRCNFKSTTFAADAIEIRVRVGDGKLSQPENKPGLDLLANTLVTAGGLGRHTAQELPGVLAGHLVSVAFGVQDEACVFTAGCPRRDLPLALKLIAAYLTDTAYRPEAQREATATLNTMYMNFSTSPSGAIWLNAMREMAGGDRRFGIARPDEVYARNIDELKAWLEPQFKHGAIELSVVGDVTWEEVSAAVARSLGALPKRDERAPASAAALALKPPRAPIAPHTYQMEPHVKLASIGWYCPIAPPTDIHEIRRCHLMAYVLTERIRQRVREELGAAYSTGATFAETEAYPNLNHFLVYAEVAPAQVDRAMAIVERETASLAFKGLTEDEFARAKPPYLHDMDDYLRTNGYWGGTVLSDAQQRPARLDAVRDRAADNASITCAEMSALAKRYFETPNVFEFAIAPPQVALAAAANSDSASLGFGDAQPVPIVQAIPVYPIDMLKQHLRGAVLVDFVVKTDGTVQNAIALKQTNESFGQAAVECVKKWRFRPGLKNGRPVPTHLQVPIDFEPGRK